MFSCTLISLWLFQYPVYTDVLFCAKCYGKKYSFRQLVIFTVSFLTEWSQLVPSSTQLPAKPYFSWQPWQYRCQNGKIPIWLPGKILLFGQTLFACSEDFARIFLLYLFWHLKNKLFNTSGYTLFHGVGCIPRGNLYSLWREGGGIGWFKKLVAGQKLLWKNWVPALKSVGSSPKEEDHIQM